MAINVRCVYSYFIYWHHMLKESMDEPGMFAIPARGQLNSGKKSLSAFALENLVLRYGFGSPIPRQPAHLHPQDEPGANIRDSSRGLRQRPLIIHFKPPYAIGSVPRLSGQLRTNGVHCRESAGTGPENLKVVPNECCLGRSPWSNLYAPLYPTPTIGMKWAC